MKWIDCIFGDNKPRRAQAATINAIPVAELKHLYKAAIINAYSKGAEIDYNIWYDFKPNKWDYIPNKFTITNEMERAQILCNSTNDIIADTFSGEYKPNIIGIDGSYKLSNLVTISKVRLYKDIAYTILADEYSPQDFVDSILLNSYKRVRDDDERVRDDERLDSDLLFLYNAKTLKRLLKLLDKTKDNK